jgi:hypothetical protein
MNKKQIATVVFDNTIETIKHKFIRNHAVVYINPRWADDLESSERAKVFQDKINEIRRVKDEYL